MKHWKQEQALRMKEDEERTARAAKEYDEDVARYKSAQEKEKPGTSGGTAKRVAVKQIPRPEDRVSAGTPLSYAKGTLTSVDCDGLTAVLHVRVPGKELNLKVKDARSLVLINTDTFSCDWRNVAVGVNYAETESRVVSLELR
jgi:hypothetical protein